MGRNEEKIIVVDTIKMEGRKLLIFRRFCNFRYSQRFIAMIIIILFTFFQILTAVNHLNISRFI